MKNMKKQFMITALVAHCYGALLHAGELGPHDLYSDSEPATTRYAYEAYMRNEQQRAKEQQSDTAFGLSAAVGGMAVLGGFGMIQARKLFPAGNRAMLKAGRVGVGIGAALMVGAIILNKKANEL